MRASGSAWKCHAPHQLLFDAVNSFRRGVVESPFCLSFRNHFRNVLDTIWSPDHCQSTWWQILRMRWTKLRPARKQDHVPRELKELRAGTSSCPLWLPGLVAPRIVCYLWKCHLCKIPRNIHHHPSMQMMCSCVFYETCWFSSRSYVQVPAMFGLVETLQATSICAHLKMGPPFDGSKWPSFGGENDAKASNLRHPKDKPIFGSKNHVDFSAGLTLHPSIDPLASGGDSFRWASRESSPGVELEMPEL